MEFARHALNRNLKRDTPVILRSLHEVRECRKRVLHFVPNDNLTIIDVRDPEEYRQRHILNSFNIPASQWVQRNFDQILINDFLALMRQIFVPELIANSCFIATKRVDFLLHGLLTTRDKVKEKVKETHRPSHNFVICGGDHGTAHAMAVIFIKVFAHKPNIKILIEGLVPEEIKVPKINTFMLKSPLPSVLDPKRPGKYQDKIYPLTSETKWLQRRATWFVPDVEIFTIFPGGIYYGDVSAYLDYVKVQSTKTPEQIFEQKFRGLYEKRWQVVQTIFDLTEHGLLNIPKDILLTAETTHTIGKRLNRTVQQHETRNTTKSKIFLGIFSKEVESVKTQQRTVVEFIDDENVKQTEYLFPNGFSFRWNVTVNMSKLVDCFPSFINCMESSLMSQEPILVTNSDKGIMLLCFFFLQNRKWTIRKTFKYLFYCLPSEEIYKRITHLGVQIMGALLSFENAILPHKWPSVCLQAFAVRQLGMEDDLAQTLHYKKDLSIRQEKALFTAIEVGDVDYVKNALTKNPYLVYARSSFLTDESPLMYCLHTDNQAIKRDKECLALLTQDQESLQLTDLVGRDALYYAIESGNYFTNLLVNKGIQINTCTNKTQMNPLQRAIKYALDVDILRLLADTTTVNHRDSGRRTPAHYMVEKSVSYPEAKIKSILQLFVENGANLFLKDVANRTPMQCAIENNISSNICDFLNFLATSEGTVRYEPNHSFAPLREKINLRYYIDGEDCFKAMAGALRSAKRIVYISDWWLTPDIILDRSGGARDWIENRLDTILTKIAKKGVQVRVLLWEHVPQVEDLRSDAAQVYLQNLHANIRCLRHSSGILDGWSHHQKILVIDEFDAFVGGLDMCLHRWDTRSHPVVPSASFPGKDYFNARFLGDMSQNDLANSTKDYVGLESRTIPRMAWHDITFRVDGKAAFDVSINFVQRWNFIASSTNVKTNYPLLSHPCEEGLFSSPTDESFSVNCQITRSIGKWSGGFQLKECSITNAIKRAILNAKSWVHIETQFFIAVQGDHSVVNQETQKLESLSDVIINRIRKAILRDENFRVIVILPVHPEGDPTAYFIKRIMFWQLQTIERIESEIRSSTRGTVKGPRDYIRFYSLVNCGHLDNKVVTEQIYIHAKLLLTDEEAICGSANLNMRSLAGDRDSEIAVVAHSSELANAIRNDLWREHLGPRVELTGDFWSDLPAWDRIARENSHIYKNFFDLSVPVGEPTTANAWCKHESKYADMWTPASSVIAYQQLEAAVNGFLVKYPRKFLAEDIEDTEKLKVSAGSFLNPGAPLAIPHFLFNIKEAAVVNVKEVILH